MTSYILKDKIKSVNFDVDLSGKFILFDDNSGTGKTFLMSIIQADCLSKQIDCVLLNYNNWNTDKENIVNMCKGRTLVLLDNADLYLTNELLKDLLELDSMFIVSMKGFDNLFLPRDTKFYRLEFKGNVLKSIGV